MGEIYLSLMGMVGGKFNLGIVFLFFVFFVGGVLFERGGCGG